MNPNIEENLHSESGSKELLSSFLEVINMVKVKIGNNVYFYDSATDVYSDYPAAVYVSGYFIADENKEG